MVRLSNGSFKLSASEITHSSPPPSYPRPSSFSWFLSGREGRNIPRCSAHRHRVVVKKVGGWWNRPDELRPCTSYITNRHNLSLSQPHVFIPNLHVSYNIRGEQDPAGSTITFPFCIRVIREANMFSFV